MHACAWAAVTMGSPAPCSMGLLPRSQPTLGTCSCYHHPAMGAALSPPWLHLQEHREEKVIVYALTCACVDFLAAAVEVSQPASQASVPLFALHGRMKQRARESRLAAYTAASSGARLAATCCTGLLTTL